MQNRPECIKQSVSSLRLWKNVDFRSTSVHVEPMQVNLPCSEFRHCKSLKQLGSCAYYSMFNGVVQAVLTFLKQSFQNCEMNVQSWTGERLSVSDKI
jgi:hypothetical protein